MFPEILKFLAQKMDEKINFQSIIKFPRKLTLKSQWVHMFVFETYFEILPLNN